MNDFNKLTILKIRELFLKNSIKFDLSLDNSISFEKINSLDKASSIGAI